MTSRNGRFGGRISRGPRLDAIRARRWIVRPLPWLRLDASLGIARAVRVRSAGNGNGLALAPRLMGQGGVTLMRGPMHFTPGIPLTATATVAYRF